MSYRILIAEDIEDSRFYLKTFLEEQGHQVLEAENGQAALRLFQEDFAEENAQKRYDLVMTDIGMPEMDGLRLLETLRQEAPELPVVIISAYREVEKIVKALRLGACDYIIKPYEEQDILNCLDKVAHLIGQQSAYHPCIGYLVGETRHFVFENNPDQIHLIAHYLSRDLAAFGMRAKIHSIQVALIESLCNAVFHGNLEISSELKEAGLDGFQIFKQEARKRMNQVPYNTRKVTIDYLMDEEKVRYVIHDDGPGFDYKQLPDPSNPENFFKPSGRGILMIQSFCDEVYWNDQGNKITLIKYKNARSTVRK